MKVHLHLHTSEEIVTTKLIKVVDIGKIPEN